MPTRADFQSGYASSGDAKIYFEAAGAGLGLSSSMPAFPIRGCGNRNSIHSARSIGSSAMTIAASANPQCRAGPTRCATTC